MLQTLLTFTVRGRPVSANAMYRHTASGVYLTRAARDWKASVRDEAWLAMRLAGRQTLPTPLQVRVMVYGSRCDVDNVLKLVLDGIKEGTGIDDRHVVTVRATRADVSAAPCIRVEILQA